MSELVRINLVKVFSTTKSKSRNELGERVTSWIGDHPRVRILGATVLLSSDSEFHCLSIVLLCHEGESAK